MNNFQSHSHLVATGPSVEAKSLPGLGHLHKLLAGEAPITQEGLIGFDTETDGFAILFQTDDLALNFANTINRMLITENA